MCIWPIDSAKQGSGLGLIEWVVQGLGFLTDLVGSAGSADFRMHGYVLMHSLSALEYQEIARGGLR